LVNIIVTAIYERGTDMGTVYHTTSPAESKTNAEHRRRTQLLLQEKGGLVFCNTPQPGHLETLPKGLAVLGRSGVGKTFLAMELIAQAFAAGETVRVVDVGGSYRRLSHTLIPGSYLTAPSERWHDPAEPFLVFDGEDARRLGRLSAWADDIATVPDSAYLIVDECQHFRDLNWPRLPDLVLAQDFADLPLGWADTRHIVLGAGMLERIKVSGTAAIQKILTEKMQARAANLNFPNRDKFSEWLFVSMPEMDLVRLHAGPRRFAAYSTQPWVLEG